ncbi:DUF2110 family protein [Natronomonas pharaonis DSM 2160]|uniref:DUF2110 family protein n=1 Tax=Natronomonas pharaonis (strain ATCC 35678 / DSM 2160 / CIP 103997 / JCM 8858 / NBRC 14720 / NCIMB 2260 / Gabara) TaxID=348780 RepID=A0A1U7EY63_NATPD|nr:DUF2110 family protein [Natronomonas pharaonis]CAI50143.1 DUF2110 family protein [Natronomonas pharaonis DSM 2160]
MVVLATKLYVSGESQRRAMDSLESLVSNVLDGLDVEFTLGLRDDDFPSVTVTGEDAPVARNLLEEEWGAIVPHREPGGVYVGTLESWDEDGLVLDAGEAVRIPGDELGLGQGSPDQIRKRFGLVQHMPLRFVEGGDDPARLADAERDRLYDWTRGNGRVNANSTTRAQLRATVNRAGHAQDIVTVERLGLLECSVVCREDTDAPGLLADIGPYLEAELLAVVP